MNLTINNKKTLALIAIVLVIWGGISFKLIQSIRQEGHPPLTNKTKPKEMDLINKRKEYTIQPYTLDPFLGKSIVAKKKKTTEKTQKRTIDHPEIVYLGKLQSKQKALHLLKMDQRIISWGIGEEKQGYVLEKTHTKLILRHASTKEIIPLIQSNL